MAERSKCKGGPLCRAQGRGPHLSSLPDWSSDVVTRIVSELLVWGITTVTGWRRSFQPLLAEPQIWRLRGTSGMHKRKEE